MANTTEVSGGGVIELAELTHVPEAGAQPEAQAPRAIFEAAQAVLEAAQAIAAQHSIEADELRGNAQDGVGALHSKLQALKRGMEFRQWNVEEELREEVANSIGRIVAALASLATVEEVEGEVVKATARIYSNSERAAA